MKRVDWFAILTLVLAVLWLFGVGSLLALYVGRLSFGRMNHPSELLGRTAALAGVAIAILGVALAGLWFGLSFTA